MQKLFSTKFKLLVMTLAVGLSAFFAYSAITYAVGDEKNGDCTSNAVIRCGVKSVDELRQKYKTDYTKGTQDIFSHFGLNSNVINTYKVQKGVVYKNGDVKVNGKLVATNAHSAGREYLAGSTKHKVNNTTFYTRPLSVSTPPSWTVYVFTDKNDRFVAAVMLACGNPVKATPVKPTSKPKPVYECASLSRIKKDSDTYTFRAKAAVKNGATLKGFTFDLGDGTVKYVAHSKHASDTSVYKYVDLNHTYKKAGTYTVKLTAHFEVNGKSVKKTSANCQKSVTIPEKPTPKPKVAECTKLTAERIGTKSFRLNATATVSGGATIDSYYFIIRDVPTPGTSVDPIYFQERINSTSTTASVETSELSALQPDKTYQATVTVSTSEGDKTGANCAVKISTKEKEQPEKVKVCNPETGDIIEVDKDKADEYEPVDSEKCQVKVCNPETGEVISVPKEDEDKYLPVDDEACQEQPPVEEEEEVVVCNPETGEIISVKESEASNYLDKDSVECQEEKPVVKGTVNQLPQTGIAEQLGGIIGLGAMTTAVYYYAISRRNG